MNMERCVSYVVIGRELLFRACRQPPNTTTNRLNDAHWTNKLPPELLGQIFVTGEGMQRGSRPLSRPYIGFQDLVTVSLLLPCRTILALSLSLFFSSKYAITGGKSQYTQKWYITSLSVFF